MESFLIAVVSMAVVLGVMILLHEFGHYAAAKAFGVRVNVFSIGFGKRLWGFRRGETDYRSGTPDEFMSHPRWQRFVIALAGPAMNILLAVFLLTVVFMVRYERPEFFDQPAVIGWVVDKSTAATAGIQQGDRIVRIDGLQNPSWEDVLLKVMENPKQPVDLAVQRGNQILEKQVKPEPSSDDSDAVGWEPEQTINVAELEPNMPALQAGLKVNNGTLPLNGEPVRARLAIRHYLQQNGAKPVDLTVLRDGHEIHFTMTPVEKQENGQNGFWLGFLMSGPPTRVEKLPFPKALSMSLQENRRYSLLIVDLVRKMLERKVSIKQME